MVSCFSTSSIIRSIARLAVWANCSSLICTAILIHLDCSRTKLIDAMVITPVSMNSNFLRIRAKLVFMKWRGQLLTKFNPKGCFNNKIIKVADYEAVLI